MYVTPEPITALVKLEQEPNVNYSILPTLFGIVILVIPLLKNAEAPIEVTVSGMVIVVNSVRPPNAETPIEVTVFGIIVVEQPDSNVLVEVSIIALQLFLESYAVLF